MSVPVDAATRERALDPTRSFIVQAPAGSGKTELLTRRVLALLATVDEPESVLAITFTRKAAKEMRDRVVETLARAADPAVQAANPHEADGLALATAVLARDQARDWQLLRNPSRLNLRTIDSLATQLATRLPVMSGRGAPSGVVDDAGALYREAATRFLDEHLGALDLVLLHLGNRLERAREMLADLLQRRDQWKRYVYVDGDAHDALRGVLEGMLAELVEARMNDLCESIPAALSAGLPPLLARSASYRSQLTAGSDDGKPGRDWDDLQELEALPGNDASELPLWRLIRNALLTQKGEPRKKITRSEGCPVSKKDAEQLGVSVAELQAHKAAWMALLADIDDDALGEHFIDCLNEVAKLPAPHYDDDQWALLSQLMQVLPDLLLELQLVFAERRQVDFVEMAERAYRALGDDDAPTDLALAMDLRVRHLLIDEFQDTSRTQFALFERLVAEWSPDDGRTFFAVGDPMQSIYRFRDGDVALFGQAQQHGVASVALESLTLQTSFRAAPDVIDWINDTFSAVFPEKADATAGAVPYSPSTAFLDTTGEVRVHAFVDAAPDVDADAVARLAGTAGDGDPDHSVAILVRSRAQAVPIFAALRRAEVPYRAIDMDVLGDRAVVRDLLSLCLALRYPHDRLHWLALLRSPFCALTLADLYALMNESGRASVFDLLRAPDRIASLSDDGKLRAGRLVEILESAVSRAPRAPVVPWVEACWWQLGGPATCRDAADLDAAERCIVRLQSLESEGQLYQRSVMASAMHQLYASSASEARVQVMTLHKAKGLEFDTVILPSLERGTRGDDTRLLDWFESTVEGQARLLLAPVEEVGLPQNRRHGINRLVREARKRCDRQEALRLLYVACTRAKRHLHVLARAGLDAAGDIRSPQAGSLLAPLWPRLVADFEAEAARAGSVGDAMSEPGTMDDLFAGDTDETGDAAPSDNLERLAVDWRPPDVRVYEAPSDTPSRAGEVGATADGEAVVAWSAGVARDVGTVVHRQLQQLTLHTAREPRDDDAGLAVSARGRKLIESGELADIAMRQLADLGVPARYLEEACERVTRAISNTLDDKRGRWILGAHTDARSEYALTTASVEGGELLAVVIDRTFVDDSGTRWIIDFKTPDHEGGNTERFLDQEQDRYRNQLQRYADIIARLESRPIRVGLYFPMMKGWREWAPVLTDAP